MNRIATTLTTLTTLTASALACQMLGATEPTLQSLEARLGGLETRVRSLESSLEENRSSYTYHSTATLEATKGSQPTMPLSAPTAPTGTSAAGASSSGQVYVIQDGDTLGKIASKFSVERKDLLAANRLSEGQPIYIGETLMIPGTAAPVSAPTPPASTAPTAPATTNVASAPKGGEPAPAKKEAIVVGDTKKPAPASTKVHTVAKGDTLTSLAKKYGTSVESVKAANGLRGDTISLGQTLKIPTTATTSTAAAPSPTTPLAAKTDAGKPTQKSAYEYENPLLSKSETYGYYTVLKGDNLYALARDFFTTMGELQRINNLGSSTVIHPGNEIIVPTSKYNSYHKTDQVANR